MTETKDILARLNRLRDEPYAAFQRKLIPNLPPETILGVRTPELRKLAKKLTKSGETEEFLHTLPHHYFDENQLHAFLLSEQKDFDRCLQDVTTFLPYIDNWATCDQLSPKVFQKHRDELLPSIEAWLASPHTYTIRFGIGMLMQYFLEEHFQPRFPAMVAAIESGEYYVNMMQAWYFATALAKQYDKILPYLQENKLSQNIHNKTIQKAVESYRITPEQKAYLKTLRRKA